MNRSKLTRLVLTLGAAALLSGCNTLYKDMVSRHGRTYYVAEDSERPFLGVLVENNTRGGQTGRQLRADGGGLFIERVLSQSPAAKAGLVAGDRILRYGVRRVRSVSDLTKAIVELGEGREVELALKGSKGQVRVVPVTPRREQEYAEIANAVLRESEVSDGTYLPFFFQSWNTQVSREAWLAYQGFELPEGARLHSGFAILPLVPDVFSLFSAEDTDIFCDASRVSLLTMPLRLNFGGGPDEELATACLWFRNVYDRL